MRLKTLATTPSEMTRPMSKEESKTFISLMMTPDVIVPASGLEEALGEDAMKIFAIAVLVKRLVHAKVQDYSINTIMFAASLATNPGIVVMWAYTIFEQTRKHGLYDMTALSMDFPMGFPTDDGYHRLWDEQKLSAEARKGGFNDNWLDTVEAWT